MAISNFARGDTRQWNITVSDSLNAPVDITGYSLYMTFKDDITKPDNDPSTVQLTGTITNGPNGEGSFSLPSDISKTMLGLYHYDVQVASTATPPVVITIDQSTVTISADVTLVDV